MESTASPAPKANAEKKVTHQLCQVRAAKKVTRARRDLRALASAEKKEIGANRDPTAPLCSPTPALRSMH